MKNSLLRAGGIFCLLLFMQSFFITAQCPPDPGHFSKCHAGWQVINGHPYIVYACEPPYPDDNSPDCMDQ